MTVLSKWATNSFQVYNGDGVAADFNGLLVRYNPELAAKSNDASEFVVLTPGASFEVAHEVGNFYNYTTAGPGAFTFKPSSIFQAVELDGSLTAIEASVDGVESRLTGKLASFKFLSPASAGGTTVGARSGLQKRATYRANCSPERQTINNEAITAAEVLAKNAVTHLNANPSGSSLQTTWYGEFEKFLYDDTLKSFNTLRTAPAEWTYDCSCTDPRKYAYVYKSEYGVVYLCGLYWQIETTGAGSRADTIIHEGTHFNQVLGTSDYAYGQTACKALARDDSFRAVYNAELGSPLSDISTDAHPAEDSRALVFPDIAHYAVDVVDTKQSFIEGSPGAVH
ncbi:hypothetical protein AAF712_008916 [Marasmius tenuissimus]|uniref:Lysine-specific metallo-endopeptidase domain-containing protein n=1 Tax=Marasmius tenuissimus TaxID=585030 RepID=A0ABR2ZTL6_9AGAR